MFNRIFRTLFGNSEESEQEQERPQRRQNEYPGTISRNPHSESNNINRRRQNVQIEAPEDDEEALIQEAIRQSLIEAKERENSVPQKMLHEEKELAEIQFNEICSVVYNPEKIIEILEKLEGVNPYDPIFHDFVRA